MTKTLAQMDAEATRLLAQVTPTMPTSTRSKWLAVAVLAKLAGDQRMVDYAKAGLAILADIPAAY
jgi:hypothetical protein